MSKRILVDIMLPLLFVLLINPAAYVAATVGNNKCFMDKRELHMAVDEYIKDDDCSAAPYEQTNTNTNACRIAQTYGWPINSWCVGNVTDMSGLFLDITDFNEDISDWDTARVTNMRGMFYYATSFNNGDLNKWNTSRVQYMYNMFWGADSFNKGDLNKWDTSSVVNMRSMFHGATSFAGDLSSWDTSSVIDMRYMFWGALAFNSDIINWDTSSVNDMAFMFRDTRLFNSDLSNWDTSSVEDMERMFYDSTSFNIDISSWDTTRVQDMTEMFAGATSFHQNLCAWADSFPYDASFDTFGNSNCSFQNDPQLEEQGPFCASACIIPPNNTNNTPAPSSIISEKTDPPSYHTIFVGPTPASSTKNAPDPAKKDSASSTMETPQYSAGSCRSSYYFLFLFSVILCHITWDLLFL